MTQLKAVIWTRVSTEDQTERRQTEELKKYAAGRYKVVRVFEEKISGLRKNSDRPVFTEMLRYITENKTDIVLVTEVSRLGRTSIEIHKTLEIFIDNKIQLFISQYNLFLLDDKGDLNILSMLMVNILASISHQEVKTTRERLYSGYKSHIRNGGKVGRKDGFKKDDKAFFNDHADVMKLINKNRPIRTIAVETGKSVGTVQKCKNLMKQNNLLKTKA